MIRLELPVTILPFISDIIKVQPQYVTATVSSINNDHNVSNRETCTSLTTQETLYTIQRNRFYQRAKISILVPFVNYITFLSLEKKTVPFKRLFLSFFSIIFPLVPFLYGLLQLHYFFELGKKTVPFKRLFLSFFSIIFPLVPFLYGLLQLSM